MKTLLSLLYLLSSILLSNAAEARVITETGPTGSTNILAIGIDSRDFEVVRFYLKGTNTLELRAEDLLHKERPVIRPPLPPALIQERQLIINRMGTLTNPVDFTTITAPTIVSNLVRLQQIDERLNSR